ncbi:MAG: transglycosylase domain-containing protein [Candidatus Nomurabacteria bacterium]|nr:transglycosylase domain-containing protein [Candidatus Nomurabacteria bacterium]
MKKNHKKRVFWKNLFMFGTGSFIFIFSIVLVYISTIKIPDFHSFDGRKVISSTKIYDRTGATLLYDIHQDVKRTIIPFDQMSINIKNATVAVEDAEFYTHGGIKFTSIVRAVLANALHVGKTQGGSTITQQLVKNTLLNSQKTILRKIKEWVLSIKIDNSMPKEKILELYLNESPYGGNIYGVQEASQTYFGKNASDVDLAEAAYIASLPQSPTTLSPYGKNLKKLEDRKNFVLGRMLAVKMIDQKEYDQAKGEVVTFLPQQTGGIKAPHFVFYIKDYLEQKYGADFVANGGLKVTTTLNYDLQQKAEAIVKEGALQNEKDWNGSNASLVAIDPKTGQILTMVGSRDYFDKKIDGNFNIATASRQPGSSFKPFIYANAFNKGFTPDTVLFDVPTEFQTTCNSYGKATAGHDQKDCYMPDDYDGKFRGPMSLRYALAQSINIPAVKLFYLSGMKDSLKTAESMGISTLSDYSRYGLTLVIGGGEVKLLDITSAYGVFANNGIRNPAIGVLKVEDGNGKILEEAIPNPREVLPKNTALTISDVLNDNVARTPTFGANSVLKIPGYDVAVKTGTTNSNKDAWTVGYSTSIAVGVWAGNNDNKPMKKGGSAVAGPIWNKFIIEALKIYPSEKFEKPNLETDPEKVKPVLRGLWQGNENFFIDSISGKLATILTPKETKVEKVISNPHSILYWVNKNDILGPAPVNPSDDSQFEHWEIPVQNWLANHHASYTWVSASQIPISSDDVHIETNKPVVTIINPNTAITTPATQPINLQINSTGRYPLSKIDVFINSIYIQTIKPPFNFSFTPSDLENLKQTNEIKLISYDSVWNRAETVSNFSVIQ